MEFKKHSGIYSLKTQVSIPANIETVWAFFSNPHNLSRITPPNMKFEITSDTTEPVYEGQIITYNISIFTGIKSTWVTEISNLSVNKYFIDEQRFGPYSLWHHEHHFTINENETVMTDIIYYKIPFGFIGQFIHPFLVKPKLKNIFRYRTEIIKQLFNK